MPKDFEGASLQGGAEAPPSDRDLVVARIKAMEEQRVYYNEKIAGLRVKLEGQNLSKWERVMAEREIEKLSSANKESWKDQVRLARSFKGGLKEAKDFLIEINGEEFFKRNV